MDQLAIKNSQEAMLLLEIASNAGALMLASGAEVYRVEDTTERIISSRTNVKDVDVYSTLNGLMLSFQVDGEIKSNIRRVKSRKYNLSKINRVNNFSRKFCNGEYSLLEAIEELENINREESVPLVFDIIGVAIATAAFTATLNKNLLEIGISFLVGLLVIIITTKQDRFNWGYFVNNFFTGLEISIITIIFKKIIPSINIDNIIIGAMMPFLTGAMLTNSVRDLMSGDTLSGLTAAITAILTTIALAIGVSLPIKIFII